MNIEVVDLFCGVGGLTYGLKKSGLDVKAGFDIDKTCEYAYEINNHAKFICKDIRKVTSSEVKKFYSKNSIKVLAGCAPCQPFSQMTKKYKNKISKDEKYNLLLEFGRIVEGVLPDIVSMENVPEIRKTSIFENRLKIIQELEKYIADEEVEKVFEKHLATNPWLINPSWERKNIKKVSTQDKFNYLNIDNSIERTRTDIIIETSQSMYPIIIELKRSKKTNYSCPNSLEIINQIMTYRNAISRDYEKNGKNVDPYDIEAYFVCGRDEKEKMYKNDIGMLSKNKIMLITYNELINTARSIYGLDVENEE